MEVRAGADSHVGSPETELLEIIKSKKTVQEADVFALYDQLNVRTTHSTWWCLTDRVSSSRWSWGLSLASGQEIQSRLVRFLL